MRPWVTTAIGTIIFAVLAAAVPLVRFSGHHELGELHALVNDGALGALAVVAIAKMCALALCLVSGWRGGEFFPLVFIGAAIGSATSLVIPGLDPGMAMATGMAATAAVGWQKPVAVVLILVLLVENAVAIPLMIGVGIAFVIGLVAPGASFRAGAEPSAPSRDDSAPDGAR